jgi:hypothetical protein
VAMGIIVAALFFSCAPSISREGPYGQITIDFAGPSARALTAGWPNNTIPTFSTVTVKVSATDMATVTTTASGSSGSVRLQVPAGNGRLIEVTALPAEGGGAPFFAKSYYGSATVDLAGGKETAVAVALSVGTSKIVLPSYDGENSTFAIAESLSGGAGAPTQMYLSDAADFELDRYGRLFVAGNGITLYTSLNEATPLSESQVIAVAYDASRNVLYSFEDTQNIYLRYRDFNGETYSLFTVGVSSEAPFSDYYGLGLAAGDGYLYATAFSYNQEDYGIGKFAVTTTGESAQATLVAFRSFSAYGIDSASGLKVNDMTYKDGVLYIAAAADGYGSGYLLNINNSRGKVIAVSTTDLAKIWDVGMSDTPGPTPPSTDLYGPDRFIGVAPKKLYVADEGFRFEDDPQQSWNYVTDVNRVVEIDLETGKISATGLDGQAAFLKNFSGFYAYDPS